MRADDNMSTVRNYLKVVLLGDKTTGKTSLMKRYFLEQFNETERPTLSSSFESKIFTVGEKEYQMGVWDTTGEERYRSICSLYYRGAAAAIICYDVTERRTFATLGYWVKELRKIEQACRLYVCATKRDLLESFEPNPSLSFAESYAHEFEAKFFLTSSKTGQNIVSMFDEILEDYITSIPHTPRTSDTIKITSNQLQWRKRRKKCCTMR